MAAVRESELILDVRNVEIVSELHKHFLGVFEVLFKYFQEWRYPQPQPASER